MQALDPLDLHKRAGFPIGAAVKTPELLTNSIYRELAATQFSSLSTENAFKSDRLCPRQNVYCWEEADEIAAFAGNNKQRLHGHTLVWHQALPRWLYEVKAPRRGWEQLLRTQVHTVVSRFRGKVQSWDVVNEAFNDDGSFRPSIWYQNLGEDYLPIAFEAAAEADPEALLFYNDYDLEYNSNKTRALLRCLENLRAGGTRVDGIGMQLHLNLDFDGEILLAETLRAFAGASCRVHFSELDISTASAGGESSSEYVLQKQAEIMDRLLSCYLKLPDGLRHGITFWGIGDAGSWLRQIKGAPDSPLLFDDDYKPKPMYHRLISGLRSR